MCGFAGEFLFAAGAADIRLADQMARRLAHRGPDEAAHFISADRRLAIGFRRLAVIDPAGSHQPMSQPDVGLTVAFNGEIYNFRQLRDELASQGAVFRTAGDTEVLLHLYDRDGVDMLDKLRGMFAFALYDARAGRLLLARDRLGQKPLWYAVTGDRVIFASEAKALLVHPAVDASVDRVALTHYLTMGYIPAPRTAFTGMRKLLPASALALGPDSTQTAYRYWQPAPADLPGDPADQAALVRDTVRSSVAARMVSDVPIGALLSGGIDSSVVVAAMCAEAGAGGGVRTFTAGFANSAYDERQAARRVAGHCGTAHTELVVEANPAGALNELVSMYDEPFADSSALPTWLICRAARQHVTVALTGDGGDEVFAGYDRYRALHLASMGPLAYLATTIAAAVVRPWAPHDERSRLRRFIRFADAASHPPSVQYFTYRRLFGPEDLTRLLTPEFLGEVDAEEPARWFCELYERPEAEDESLRGQYHDLATYLPDDLLVKTDIASMAASLELRAPMLDHDLVAVGLGLPVSSKLGVRGGKKILREAFADMLPPDVLSRPKRGFAVPLDEWLRGSLLEALAETLLDEGLLNRGIFRRDALAGLINDHLSGRGDHRHRLWGLLVLARWLARYG